MTAPDRVAVAMYSFDCRDAAALAAFWAGVLGRTVDEGATAAFATIGFHEDDGPVWMFHQLDGELPAGKARLMLDLGGGDAWAEQADRVEALGAKRVGDHDEDGVQWVVLHDPEGNTFRVFGPRPG